MGIGIMMDGLEAYAIMISIGLIIFLNGYLYCHWKYSEIICMNKTKIESAKKLGKKDLKTTETNKR